MDMTRPAADTRSTLAHGDDLPDDPAVLRRAARLNRVPVLRVPAVTWSTFGTTTRGV